MHKEVVIVITRGIPISPWLRNRASVICHSLDDAIAYLVEDKLPSWRRYDG